MKLYKFPQEIYKAYLKNTEISHTVIYTTIVRAIGVALRFLVIVFITRLIGVEQFGVYTYVTQLMTMVAVISFFGADHYLLKEIPKCSNDLEGTAVNEKITSVIIINFLIGVVAVSAIRLKSNEIVPSAYFEATDFGALLVFPMLFLFFQNALLRANHKPVSSQLFENVFYPIMVFLCLQAMIWWLRDPSVSINAYEALLATIISYYFTSAVGLLFLCKNKHIKLVFMPKGLLTTLQALCPLSLIVILYQIYYRLPIFVIGDILGAKELAQYFVASRLAEFIEFPLGIVCIVFVSRYSALKPDERGKKQLVLNSASIILLVSSLLIYILILFFSEPIFKYFGKEMIESYDVYAVLGLGYVVASTSGFVDFALISAGHSTIVSISLLISTVILLTLFFIIPIASPLDVAFIYAFSWMFNKFMMAYYLWKKEMLSIIPVPKFIRIDN